MKKRTKALYYSIIYLLFFYSCKATSDVESSNNAEIQNPPSRVEKESEYFSENYFRYEDFTYKENINTVLLYAENDQLSPPILYLNDDVQLSLRFDDLSAEHKTYSYKFIHCDADWTPSILQQQEFLDGFTNNYIDNYQYSFNTLQSYITYTLKFPNDMIQFRKSGNYLLKVYDNNDEEDVVLTRRFFVVDKKVDIDMDIHYATLARYRDYKQEVDFNIMTDNYPILDPYGGLKILIRQNRRWDNAVSGLRPLFIKDNLLTYNYEDDNLFDAGNEFRNFNMTSLNYQTMNIDGIQYENGETHVFVLKEEPRSHLRYYTREDINGKRLIKRDESVYHHRESDYARVHFSLQRENAYDNGNIYIFGGLSDWRIKEEFKMEYNAEDKVYEGDVVLKQGYYDYVYVLKADGKNEVDFSAVEGSHFETENDYEIFVYHRPQGQVYDQLIGYNVGNSRGNLKNILKE